MKRADAVLVLVMGLAVAHLAVLGWWIVDDAAISFAYSRSFAEGQGMTPYFGGEQVEGYSNPTWVALIAIGQRLGADPFSTAKALSFAFVAATVPLVHALASRVNPLAGLPAAVLFAANTQVAVFGAAGLENPLLWFLLTLGLLLVSHEVERGTMPWSGVVFALLGATRPEGLLYAAAVGPWIALAALRERRGARQLIGWALLLVVPTALYQLIRASWFAFPYPMTYYAKVHSTPEVLMRWQGGGWRYLRGFALDLGRIWTLPVFLVGALGGRWRWVVGATLAVALLALLPSTAKWWGPPAAIGLLALAVGLAAPIALSEGWLVRGMCWTVALAAAVFAIRAGGDWMSGHRWFANTAVPGAVLGALGLVELAIRVPKPAAIGGVVVALAAFVAVNLSATFGYRVDPETSAFMVGQRVKVARDLLARIQLDDRPVIMTFDLGGFLWWSGMEIVDAMGLVDVPVAMNKKYGPLFWDEYVAERRPHLLVQIGMRAGGDLAEGEVITQQYVDLTRGTRVRRDLLFEPAWTGAPEAPVDFEAGVVLAGFEVLREQVADEPIRVDLGVRSTAGASFTAELVLADEAGTLLASWPVPLAHGMLATPLWRPEEVFHGRYSLALPAGLVEGRYPFGIRLSASDRVLTPIEAALSSDGVLWLGDAVQVVDAPTALAAAAAERAEALGLAATGRCEEADRAGLPDAEGRTARAACWLARTDGDRIAAIERARKLDPELPGLAEAARPLAEARYAEGMAARASGDVDLAFRAFSDVMRLDPGQARARRYAEEARFERLGGLRKAP